MLQNLKDNSSQNKKIKEITKELKRLERDWNNYVPKTEVGKIINKNKKGKGLKSFKEYIEKIKMGNMDATYLKLLGVERDGEKKETTEKKFAGIEKISSGIWLNEEFLCTIDLHCMVNILYGYIYVKALRNQINHASSDENLTEEQKKILEQQGFFPAIDIKSIQGNLFRLLNNIEQEAEKKRMRQIEDPIVPTTLNIGDVVRVKCVDNKKVLIENHPYHIQLVVDPVIDSVSLVGAEFDVRVKQISNRGRLCQVKYIRE